jgi:gamma-glutamyltranspeptidase/glutathione hydrolase
MQWIYRHYRPKRAAGQTLALLLLGIFVLIQPLAAQPSRPSTPEPATEGPKGTAAAYGSRYMIVTSNPDATQAGAQILQGGGSAADAAIAAQLVLGLVEPQSSGIGGGGFALYYDAASKQVHSFDGRETAPESAGQYLFRGEDGKPMDFYDAAVGGRAVGTPGLLRMMETMHKRFGAKPWRDLFSPAITLAETGFTVSKRLAALAEKDALRLRNFPATTLYFFPDAANPIQAGQRYANPPYGRILRDVALKGADAFYTGDNAESIVKAVQEDFENPGLLSLEDLANYKAIERETLCNKYRGHLVCTMGEPSAGGLSVLIALGILEKFDLGSLGPRQPKSWHLISEASRMAFADRNYYMGDPHYVQSPGKLLLDPQYLMERAKQIDPDKAAMKVNPGVPAAWKKYKGTAEPNVWKPPGTTHISVVDARGNIVSMTSSIEDMFGSRMYVNGYMLNNQLTDFSFVPEMDGKVIANRVEGGKRPRSDMAPVIVFDPFGKPLLVIGAAGGSAIPGYVLERIISVIDWKKDIAAAIAAPHIINRGKGVELEDGAADMAEPLRKFGHPVEMKELNSGLTAIYFKDGRMTGAADPRREGTAMGE